MPTHSSKTSLAQQTISGLLWILVSNYSGKIMVFISTIVLARLLNQEDFGLAGYALVAISQLTAWQGLGIGPALIYHHEEDVRTNTAFWLGLAVGLILFGLTWSIAPLIGWFFQDQRAISITRALGLTFPISALELVHSALLSKHLAFKRKFLPSLVRSISKGTISISFALLGFGAWSLIFGQLAGATASVITHWRILAWRPSFQFNHKMVGSLLSYGLNIVALDSLSRLATNGDYLLIGRYLGAAALGVYTVAFRIPELLIENFCVMVSQVIFPAYSTLREDRTAVADSFLSTMRYVTIVTVPVGLGLALVAEPFVLLFYTEKWADAIGVMQAIAILTLVHSLIFNIGDVYKAQGRPELLTKLAIVYLLLLLPALLWVISNIGTLVAIAWTQTAVTVVHAVQTVIIANKLLNTSFTQIATALQPAILSGLMMSLAVLSMLIVMPTMPPLLELLLSVSVGGGTYISTLWVFQKDTVKIITQNLRQILTSKLER